ncbi:transporter substrate-binding domain-containing protein [Hymenobacter cellulosivorans]|uniref:Solute-binding protein family 3/N-terminal domain-containing protein n=1 Tax=Hymenobacter cellulosivorans TaxID=2932249 RepID=A0ABY4FDZ6_9BACT|nr:hypothetical protein [Hymenobacter cellulosivorans]UOQ54331.1 hypothetical protein MUN80_06120 [Hymenobacter cellulosivorans]
MKLLLISGCLLTVSSMIYLMSLGDGLYEKMVDRAPGAAQGTLARVRGTVLRVGYTPATPGQKNPSSILPQGPDAVLITGLARQLSANVEWVPGSEQQLYRALRNRKIDLLIGNLTEQTPGKDNTAPTRPHLENANYAYLRYKSRGRIAEPQQPARTPPAPQDSTAAQPEPVALTDGRELAKTNPVIAVPAGEKAWLAALETYLNQHQLASTGRQRQR